MLPAAALPLALIEDQPGLRDSLGAYLGAQPEFDCVLVAGSVEELLAALPTARRSPALVVSDIGLPGLSGIEGLPRLLARLPQAQVVMLSIYTDSERVFQALCAGAVGYLDKTTPPARLKEALLEVVAGGSPMSPAVARHVVRHFQPRPVAGQELLTARERQVVQAIEEGLSYKLIAARLGISLHTVRNHIRSVYQKLQINSMGELWARRR